MPQKQQQPEQTDNEQTGYIGRFQYSEISKRSRNPNEILTALYIFDKDQGSDMLNLLRDYEIRHPEEIGTVLIQPFSPYIAHVKDSTVYLLYGGHPQKIFLSIFSSSDSKTKAALKVLEDAFK